MTDLASVPGTADIGGGLERSGVLQGSWGLGYALSAAAYGLLYTPLEAMGKGYGWRGMLILGGLPALACL